MAMMAKDKIKKIIRYVKNNTDFLRKKIFIAMMVGFAVIAIILVSTIIKTNKKNEEYYKLHTYKSSDIEISECKDPYLYKFISDYFRARTNLNYPKIFASFGRDYYKEKREKKSDELLKLEDSIRYERTFVKSYDDIKVYSGKGVADNDVICIVTYDLSLGFTNDKAPMIIIFYIEKKDEGFVIKDDFDVATSKFIYECMKNEYVKDLLLDTKNRLTKLVTSNESLKLAYNSLRQYEINQNGDRNYKNASILDHFGYKAIDPIEDADKIYDYIVEAKKESEAKARLDNVLSEIIASISVAK